MNRTNYIFVDFENVHVRDLETIRGKAAHVTLLLGEQQKTLPVPMVQTMLRCPGQVEVVATGRAGKNALDMVLATYMGERKATDPTGIFHVVSKDRDYNAVIAHFRAGGIQAQQHKTLAGVFQTASRKTSADLIQRYRTGKLSRPKTKSKLQAQLQAQGGGNLKAEQAEAVIQELQANKIIEILADQTVRYLIPAPVTKASG